MGVCMGLLGPGWLLGGSWDLVTRGHKYLRWGYKYSYLTYKPSY